MVDVTRSSHVRHGRKPGKKEFVGYLVIWGNLDINVTNNFFSSQIYNIWTCSLCLHIKIQKPNCCLFYFCTLVYFLFNEQITIDFLLQGIDRISLLREVLTEMASSPQTQRLYLEFNEQLKSSATAIWGLPFVILLFVSVVVNPCSPYN